MREGRRSFYRLTPDAAAEFEAAARVLHGPGRADGDACWTLVALSGEGRAAAPGRRLIGGAGFGAGVPV